MHKGYSIRGYSFEEMIGAGGMGEIWAAKRTNLGDRVAIKILKVSEKENLEEAKKNLFKEARATSLIQHPNVCKIYEFFEEDNVCYLVMELLQGMDLCRFHQLHRHLPDSDRVRLGLYISKSVLKALNAAHHVDTVGTNKILHRDIKPSNIFLTIHGEVKLLDLGIAKLESDFESTHSTRYGYTEAYSSPDLWDKGVYRGELYSTDNDLYSLGLVFQEILTGDLHRTPENLSENFKIVLNKWLSPNKEKRFQEVNDLQKLIEDESSLIGHVSEEIVLKYVGRKTPHPDTIITPKDLISRPRKKASSYKIWGSGVLLCLVCAFIIWKKAPIESTNEVSRNDLSVVNEPVPLDINTTLKISESDFPQDNSPKFHISVPGRNWKVFTGPKSLSVLDEKTCKKDLNEKTWCLFEGNSVRLDIHMDTDQVITQASLMVRGESEARLFRDLVKKQLKEKGYETDSLNTNFKKDDSSVMVTCYADSCTTALTLSPEASYKRTAEKNQKDIDARPKTNFHFRLLSPDFEHIKFKLGPDEVAKIKSSKLKCTDRGDGLITCAAASSVDLRGPNDMMIQVEIKDGSVQNIRFLFKNKTFLEKLMERVRTTEGFVKGLDYPSNKSWMSGNELVSFTWVPEENSGYLMEIKYPYKGESPF